MKSATFTDIVFYALHLYRWLLKAVYFEALS